MTAQFIFDCPTADDTMALASVIGSVVKGGEVLEFKSDLGGGKTTFVKGLAKGMKISDTIQSPTFTISQIHKSAKNLELHHFDFYRLNDAGIMSAELYESLHQPNAMVAIEWGDIVQAVLPRDYLTIELTATEADGRIVRVTCPKSYEHIATALYEHQQIGAMT